MAWLVYRQRARHRKSGRLKRYTGAVFVKCVRPKLLDALGEDLWTHTLRLRGEEHEAGTVRGAGCLQGCDMLGPPAFVQAVDLVGPPGQRRAMRLEVTHTVADFKEQEGAGGDVEVRGGPFCSTTLTEQEARELGQLCGWSRAEFLETDALKLPPLMRRHVLGLCYRCGGARGPEPLHWVGDCPARAFVAARAMIARGTACRPGAQEGDAEAEAQAQARAQAQAQACPTPSCVCGGAHAQVPGAGGAEGGGQEGLEAA